MEWGKRKGIHAHSRVAVVELLLDAVDARWSGTLGAETIAVVKRTGAGS
jgi:hypothetical protein